MSQTSKNNNEKECSKCTDLKSSTIAHGKACAKECAEKAKQRELARPDQATLQHSKECAQECASVAKERSSHCDERRQTMQHGKECAAECAQKAKERASQCEELKQAHEHGRECAHECAEKAKQRAHALGKDPIEISTDTLSRRKNLESVKNSLAEAGRGALSNAICTLEDTFNKAVFWLTHAEALGDRTSDDKCFSYALWMQATHGDVCDCDRYLTVDEKARWSAWNKLKGMNRAEAMSRYIAHCAKVNTNWVKDQMLDSFPTTEQVKSNVSSAFEAVKNSTAEAGEAVKNRASELADSLLGQQQQQTQQQQPASNECNQECQTRDKAVCNTKEFKQNENIGNRAKLNAQEDARNKQREQATA